MSLKIDFVFPPSITDSYNYSCEPALGLLSLLSHLAINADYKISFLDSAILDLNEIVENVKNNKADIVAISTTSFNYQNTIKISEAAKKNKSLLVLGGIHIGYYEHKILPKMLTGERYFHYLVKDFGEEPFCDLLVNIEKNVYDNNAIFNLSYIEKNKVNITPRRIYNYDPATKPINYSLIDFSTYNNNFKKRGNLKQVNRIGTIYTQRGCKYRGQNKCVFCSINKSSLWRDYNLVENDVLNLIINHNIDHIRICDADFTTSMEHLKNVFDAVKKASLKASFKPTFYCFTRADEINEESVKLLKGIGVISVFIGYESGSNSMLKSMHKNTTREQNIRATKLLAKAGIDVACAGIVIGAEGENQRTLDETLSFIHELKRIKNVNTLAVTPLIPMPGSVAYYQLLKRLQSKNRSRYKEIATDDKYDFNEFIKLWNYEFSNVPITEIIKTIKIISDIFPLDIQFLNPKDI